MFTGGNSKAYNFKRLFRLVLFICAYLPFAGTGAIKKDFFQPLFQSQYQTQEKYVINQKHFVTHEVSPADFYKDTDIFNVVEIMKIRNGLTYEDMLKYLPTSLAPTTSEQYIAKALVDNAFRQFILNGRMKDNEVIKAISNLEKAINTNIEIAKDKDGTTHTLNFDYYIAESTTKISYHGYLNGFFTYKSGINESNITVEKNVNIGKLSLVYLQNPSETRNVITLGYNF